MGTRRTARPTGAEPFAADDYEEVNALYFADLLRTGTWKALPAGWHNPHNAAAAQAPAFDLSGVDRQRYALDEGHSLAEVKKALAGLASLWEGRTLAPNDLTLCPSVACANLVVLCALRRRGVRRIVLETPNYFATAEQAKLLGFDVVRIPSFMRDGFEAPLDEFVAAARGSQASAVWITQPRFGVGGNQPLDRARALCAALGKHHVLVSDEAAEQNFPSHWSAVGDTTCDVIRTRGLLKGVGLNGLRISMVLHPAGWRDDMERVLEVCGASLDRYSLATAEALAREPRMFEAMLKASNEQVLRLRRRLEVLLVGSWAAVLPLENSYIGTVVLDFDQLDGTYAEKRSALLEHCRDVGMPVTLRASIGFAFDPSWEGVRVNFFTPDENVERSGRLLADALVPIRERLRQG
jgi:histidinol-phosphate/aromatic aminotransferase/cobyric acid decarboxylase-like protein